MFTLQKQQLHNGWFIQAIDNNTGKQIYAAVGSNKKDVEAEVSARAISSPLPAHLIKF